MAASSSIQGNAFETARRVKVYSVDPQGIPRSEIHGERERPRVFQVLRSFDHRGMAPEEFAQRTLELLKAPGAQTAGEVLRCYLEYYAALSYDPDPRPRGGIAEAEEILRHRFTFAGEGHQLPAKIDWDFNPGSPHWGYELNRFSFLHPLLSAFVETGERKYVEKAVELIFAWIDDTDICDAFTPGPDPTVWELSVKSRYVWLSHLEVGIHLMAWGAVLSALLREVPDLIEPDDFLRLLKSVHDQLTWLEVIMPEGGHGNGLINGAGCQLSSLVYFPAFRDTERLAETALARIEATLAIQVLPDGVQHELTPHYHFCVTKDLPNVFEALEYLPFAAPPSLERKLHDMLWYVRQTLTPDGKQVTFNDGDAGLGAWTSEHLQREAAQRLLGSEAQLELTSQCFPYAGVMVMRQGSRYGRDELYLAFDGGLYGNIHQHEDKLSCWLSAYGRSFIVDPGRHRYDWSEGSYYLYLQSTKAHSTIRIDDRDQNSKAHPNTWVAHDPLPLTWQVGEDGTIVAGASYTLGYGPESIPVTHTRTIRFFPDPGYWVLEDEVTGEGRHDIESRFQFAPGELVIEGDVIHTTYPDANLALILDPVDWDDIRVEQGQESPRAGWYSDRVNQIEPAPALALYARNRQLPFRTTITLYPYRCEQASIPVTLTHKRN
ncbi:MAG: heparinase II/III domain-containing protein [Armatimonadota bacterium]